MGACAEKTLLAGKEGFDEASQKALGLVRPANRPDRLDSTAAHGAFFLLISFLPFVAFLLTLMQRIHFSDGPTLIEAALQAFPDSVASYLEALLPTPIQSTGCCPSP